MQKCVNGQLVNLTQAEIDDYNARQLEWLQGSQQRLEDFYKELLRATIDEAAQQKNYDNAACCATYANSTNLTWKAEAEAFIAWRDACWDYAITLFAEIENEQTPDPGTEGFINNLPVLNW